MTDDDWEHTKQTLARAAARRPAQPVPERVDSATFTQRLAHTVGKLLRDERRQIDAEIAALRRRITALEADRAAPTQRREILRSKLPTRR